MMMMMRLIARGYERRSSPFMHAHTPRLHLTTLTLLASSSFLFFCAKRGYIGSASRTEVRFEQSKRTLFRDEDSYIWHVTTT